MTGPNLGDAHVNVTELLTALAAAEQKALDSPESAARSGEYRLGLTDAYAGVQALVRDLAGWPVEADSDRTT